MPKKDTAPPKKAPAKKKAPDTPAKKPVAKKESTPDILEHKPIGSIYVEKGVTKNMGDFNSARVTVGVTLNVNPTDEEIEEARKTITVATEMLDTELGKQIDELMT